jgi:DNA-binding NarL/FixJ family response regulator
MQLNKNSKKHPVKILVVDDHSIVREGLRQVLKGLKENLEVLQAATCAQAFALAQTHGDIDLVLLDYHLPDMNGLKALSIFSDLHPELPVVMISGSANPRLMRQVLQAGAAGFVTKSSVTDELMQAVRSVLAGETYLPPELNGSTTTQQDPGSAPPLTQRQEMVLRGLLDGMSNREIADHLHISEETVKTRVAAILRHFNVQNRTQAVVIATRIGYLSLSQQ